MNLATGLKNRPLKNSAHISALRRLISSLTPFDGRSMSSFFRPPVSAA
jgi:hypothetical protein